MQLVPGPRQDRGWIRWRGLVSGCLGNLGVVVGLLMVMLVRVKFALIFHP
jgi:hypothetical protein